MKRLALLLLTLLALAPSARAEDAPATLLWVPRTSTMDWDGLVALMDRNPGLRLSLAVSPLDLPQRLQDPLLRLSESGRIDFVLRLDQDPLLPVLQDFSRAGARIAPATGKRASRTQDVAHDLSVARQAYKDYFGRLPQGLAPAGGAVSAELLPLLKAMGLRWVAVGVQAPSISTEAVPASTQTAGAAGEPAPALSSGPVLMEGLVLLPFAAQREAGGASGRELAQQAGGPMVLDETLGWVSSETLKELLMNEPKLAFWKRTSWATAADLLVQASTPPASGVLPPPWTGDLAPWTEGPARSLAWKLLADASLALDRYLNSGRASVPVLDEAAEFLRQAEAGELFLRLGGADGPEAALDADAAFRDAVSKVFDTIKSRPPEALKRPLIEAPAGQGGAPVAGVDAQRAPGAEEDAFELEDAEGDARAPKGQSSASPYDLLGFKAQWSDDDITFTVQLASPAAEGMAPPLVDLYVDLNHRVGSGASSLLPGRGAYLRAEDAWEYALVLSAERGVLVKPARGASPDLSAGTPLTVKASRGRWTVKVPRSVMKGHPGKWGFLLVVSALDASSDAPFTPLTFADGGSLLDLLELQPSDPASARLLQAVRPADAKAVP